MSEELSSVGHMEDEALKRKERLKALKRRELKRLAKDDDKDEDKEAFPKPLFRNYVPKDDTLKPGVLPKPELIEIENEIKDQLESAKPTPLIEKEIDLTTLAPQKIDWDLKRDLEKSLKILKKRTHRAIVDLIKDRLQTQKNADLAELVSVGAGAGSNKNKGSKNDQNSDEDDDEEDEEEDDNRQKYSFRTNVNESEQDDSPDVDESNSQPINDKREISDDDDIY